MRISDWSSDVCSSDLVAAASDGSDNRATGYWWQQTGAPVLSALVEQGLARNQKMVCEALALHKADVRAKAHSNRLDIRINRLFGDDDSNADMAVLKIGRASSRERV